MFPILDMRTWGEGEARLGNAFIALRRIGMVQCAYLPTSYQRFSGMVGDDVVTRKHPLRNFNTRDFPFSLRMVSHMRMLEMLQ